MEKFNEIKINTSLATIVLIVLIVLVIILFYIYSFDILSPKWAPVVGGAAVAALIAVIQFSISFLDHRNNERLSISGVKNFLSSRDDKKYYSNLIERTERELVGLFYTSKRFCEDFCTEGGGDNLLIKQLDNNSELKVRILVASKNILSGDEQANFSFASKKLNSMIEKYPGRFEVKVYDHIQTHNIFLTDKDAVIGPYFYNKNGKYSHSIHFNSNASFVKDYKDFFEHEWINAIDYH